MKNVPLKPLSYLALVSFLLILAYSYTSTDTASERISDITLSLATSFISVIITVLILDQYIESKRRAEKIALNKISLRTLKYPMEYITRVFYHIDKATALKKGAIGSQSISDYLESLDNDQIRHLNCQLDGPEGFPTVNWEVYLVDRFDNFTKAINRLLERHTINLDAETIALCEDIANHFFPKSLKLIRETRAANKELIGEENAYGDTTLSYGTRRNQNPTLFEDYIEKLRRLTLLVSASHDAKDLYVDLRWEDNLIPLLGSCRLPDRNVPWDPFKGKDNVKPDINEKPSASG